MTSFEFLQQEVQRLGAEAAEYERLYLRAREAGRGHQIGLRRALVRMRKAESELALERAVKWAEAARLRGEIASLQNKVERLSLKLMSYWSQE